VEVAQRRGYEWDFVSSAKSPKNFWHFFTECRLNVLKEIPYLGIKNIHSRALITAVLQIIFFNQHYYIFNSGQHRPISKANSGIFMIAIYVFFKSEDTLPCSKQPPTCPYPKPDKSIATSPILFL